MGGRKLAKVLSREMWSLRQAPCPIHPRVSVSGTQQAFNKYLQQELLHNQAVLVFPFSLSSAILDIPRECALFSTEPK